MYIQMHIYVNMYVRICIYSLDLEIRLEIDCQTREIFDFKEKKKGLLNKLKSLSYNISYTTK
jgi:hypothetical protein